MDDQQIAKVVASCFDHRERKINESAARHAFHMAYAEVMTALKRQGVVKSDQFDLRATEGFD